VTAPHGAVLVLNAGSSSIKFSTFALHGTVPEMILRGQVAVLQEIVTRPLDLGAIAEAEGRLKEVIFKQGMLRTSLQEAKAALKQLITSFIDRLGDLLARHVLRHDDDQLDARIERLEDRVLREVGRHRHDRARDADALLGVCGDGLRDRLDPKGRR